MIKAVFLDVGGIVIKIDWKNPLKVLGVEQERRQEIVDRLKAWEVFHRFEEGRAEPEEFFAGINAQLGLDAPPEKLKEAWNSLIVGDLPGTDLIFDWLKWNKIPVFALSNTNAVHDAYQFPRFPVLARFDHFYKSYKMGARKPGVEIYQLAAKHAGFKPEECLFIDDTWENVEGARAAGWQAHQTVDNPAMTLTILQQELG